MRTGQKRKPDSLNVFLDRGGRDLLGSLADAGIDDLEACVAQGARDDLGPPVVSVKAGFGDKDPDPGMTQVRVSIAGETSTR